METLVFLKLGGSLITDKTRAYTPRPQIISRLAAEIRRVLDQRPDWSLLIGHGSGSFGHWAARPYSTRTGVYTPDQWRGYAKVAAAAARLNRMVADALLDAGVPALSLQPSASARCYARELVYVDTRPIHDALARGLVPLVYGDVAFDEVCGGTIVSTEGIFAYLAGEMLPARILLVGEAPGVLSGGVVVPRITPADLPAVRRALSGSEGIDVTGGMADKVLRMVRLVARHPEIRVHILSGAEPGVLARALLDDALPVGTRIVGRAD